MSALSGLGVDNVLVGVNAAEIPIMDGSAASFVYLIHSAGIAEQDQPKRFVEVTAPIEVRDGEKYARLEPYFGFRLSFSIDFQHPAIDQTGQKVELGFAQTSFLDEIARARTFGFAHEVDALRAAGLARGGSLDNAVVISGNTVLNGDGLRYEDEFVRHKILDCVGDLYLAGAPIIGQIVAERSGHALNNQFLIDLFKDDSAWSYVEMTSAVVPGTSHRAELAELAIA